MKKRKLNLLVSGMSVVLAVQTPVMVLAESLEGTEQQIVQEEVVETEVLETEEDISEEILEGTGEEIVTGTEEEILPGTEGEEEQVLTGTSDITHAGNSAVQEALDRAESYLQATVTSPIVDTNAGEWSVMGMARAGHLTDSAKGNYLANLYMKLDETGGVLHKVKYTEYSRVVMALSSIGADPSNVNGHNLLKPLAKYDKVIWQGINGTIFALIALDTGNYEIPVREGDGTQTTRELLIQEILSKELPGGGWTLQGSVADPDITAMAIQGLASYKGRADVSAALNRGIDKLASMQDADGGYSSNYISGNGTAVKNLESTAQVVIALSAVDVSLLEQERFVKNGKTLLDEILRFQKADGSFEHIKGGGTDGMATDQGTLALVAWSRAMNGQTSLYDMTDVTGQSQGTESPEKVEAFRKKLEELPKQVTLAEKEQVYNLKIELEQMKAFEEKESFRNFLEEKSAEIERQEKEVEALDERIWNEIHPLKITLEKKETVEELYSIYKSLPEQNKSFVTRSKDLEMAKQIVTKLEKMILGKEIFENAKNSRKDYVYEGDGYTIRIKGKKVSVPADMNAAVQIHQDGESLEFTIMQEGKLPGEVELTIPCDLNDGVYVLSSGQREEQWCGVSDGKAVCDVSWGGTYTLRRGEMDFEDETEPLAGVYKEEKQQSSGKKQSARRSTSVRKKTSVKPVTTNIVEAKVKDGVVKKSEFEAVKGTEKNLRVKGEIGKDKPYTLTVYGKDIKKARDMKVGIREGSDYKKDTQKLAEKPYMFAFEETGDFPGEMQVELTTGQKDGEYLLLKYNEKERKAEYIQKVTVKDEKTKFIVKTGGDYFFAKRVKTKSVDELEQEEKAAEKKDAEQITTEKKEIPETTEEKESAEETFSQKSDQKNTIFVVLAGVLVVLGSVVGGCIWYFRKKRQ